MATRYQPVRDPLARLSLAEIERRLGVMAQIHPVKLTSMERRVKARLQYFHRHQKEGA